MNKLKLFSLFAAVMFAASMWGQSGEKEGPWTWMDMRSGCCDRTANYSISFNGLNNSHWGDISFWNDADGIGYTVKGTSPNQQKNGVFSTYFIDQNLESYSKKVLTWKFKVGSKDTKHYSNTALYALQGTWQQINALTVDFTEEYNNQAGSSYLIGRYRNTSYNKAYTGETPQTTVQITKGSTGNKTYTANWTPNPYTITYDLAGGQGTNPATYTVETPTFQLAAPQRPGYNFLGWTGSNGNTPQTAVQIAKGSTGDKNYVAHWAIDPNTNVVYLDSLDNTAAQEIVAFNRPEAPEVAGFAFVRWDVVEGPLSEGITLQAIYAENEPSGAPKKQVGKFTLTRKGDKNEYILQTAK